MDSFALDLLQDLECPICLDYMVPPITLCIHGHSICHNCRPTLRRCPSCRCKLMETRSLPLENLSARITHPCTYRREGCTAQLLHDFKEEHLKECPYRPHHCPYVMVNSRCSWKGPMFNLETHIKDVDHFIINVDKHMFYTIEEGEINQGFICSFDEIFFCYTQLLKSFFHVAVMYVGSKELAKNYNFRVTIDRKDEGPSMSIRLPCQSYLQFLEWPWSFSDHRCAIFPKGYCKYFSEEFNGRQTVPCKIEIIRSNSAK
ncbi:hypothetical protein C0J52_25128 [Blattella germanica]|nr:hypothetical protein C0J52_25128 [Blattella germanica]